MKQAEQSEVATVAVAASTSLREALTAYRRGIAPVGDASESLRVEVVREGVFVHRAVMESGLTLVLDEPASFGGSGSAPDPAECLLAAVGASVSVTLAAHAALRNVPIDGIRIALDASIDARKFFYPGDDGKPGLADMTLRLMVRSSAPRGVLQATIRDALRVAPVLRSLKRKPRVVVVHESFLS